MNIQTINDLIDELEHGDTSLSNIRNLSALYNVKSHLINKGIEDSTTKELNDILPSYLKYIEMKRKYQMGEITEDAILSYLKYVCKEIKEFIRALYSGTDTPKEREIILTMLQEVH